MNRSTITFTLSAVAVLGLAGCATVPKEAGFGDVQRTVSQRTGHLVQWRGRTADDAALDAAIASLLQRNLTADDAVQIALLNNLNLQATYQDLGVAQADLVQAGLLKNPTLSLERRLSGQAFEADVMQDFLDFFMIPLRKKIATSQFEAAKLRVGQAVLETTAETQSTFYMFQGARQIQEMRRSVLEAATASADAARRLHEAGNTSLLALGNEQKLAAQARLDLAEAEAEVVQQREKLNVLMGVWGSASNYQIANRLPELPKSDIAAPGLESQAIAQRLDLAAGKREIEAAVRSLGITQTFRYIPAITISGHFEREPDGLSTGGPSIAIGLPLFDQGQALTARGSALVAQSQQRYAAKAIEIRSQVRSAYARMVAARSRAQFYRREVLPLQQRILQQTQLQFNGMFLGVFQLLQAKQAQIDAGREYIEATRDYWVARSELEHAIGGRLPGPAPDLSPGPPPALPSPAMGPMNDMPGMPGVKQPSGMKDMPGMKHTPEKKAAPETDDMPGMKHHGKQSEQEQSRR